MRDKYRELCAYYKADPNEGRKQQMKKLKWDIDMLSLDMEINQILVNQQRNGNSLLVGC